MGKTRIKKELSMSYPEPPNKRKNQSPLRVLVNAWGCLLGLVMLALGGAIGLLGAIFVAPELLGFDLTATALAEHEIVLASTAVDLEQRAENAEASATSFYYEVEATRAVMLNEYELLGQTATQSSQNISATGTAAAVESVQRQTQIALDYQATQSQLQENATDAEIDFRNTQAALGIITQVSPTETPVANISASNPDDFRLGLDETVWQVSNAGDWQESANGLRAFQNNAWLLERETRLLPETDFNIELVFEATGQANSEYWFMVVSDESNLAVYLKVEGTTILEAAFYSFELATLENGALAVTNSNLISRVAARTAMGDSTTLALIREENWLRVSVNGQVLLLTELQALSNGRLGIQLPLGASLQSVEQN
jgi:hypothetical protein